ncbi:hypothetical protein RUM43_006700 [Polyplax serrata]|uniref:LisH domain-containing protein n=1 Tax=Polyplax serrata TaxID=468196 RepID=A0AAN8NYK1_POLSC
MLVLLLSPPPQEQQKKRKKETDGMRLFHESGFLTTEEMNLKKVKTTGKTNFQQELDKWFKSRGIISDLRSHLRHLMVTALQNADLTPKSWDESSPKVQALNMLVAEYLFRKKCHYTLSVFASEVPAVSGFSAAAGKKSDSSQFDECLRRSGNGFQKYQLEEICHALGLPPCPSTVDRLKNSYFRDTDDRSLLELLLHTMLEMWAKLDVQHTIESRINLGKGFLSPKWTSDIADILLNENIEPVKMIEIQKSIASVTETEVKNIAQEERGRQMRVLTEREKRIQEYLRDYEEHLLGKLLEAEKGLTLQKDLIDEQFAERKKYLFKMAVEWKETHEEIIRLANNFYVSLSVHTINNENVVLRKLVEELKIENGNLKNQEKNQRKKINSLEEEIREMSFKWKEAKEANASLKRQIQVLSNKRHAKESPSEVHFKQAGCADVQNGAADYVIRTFSNSPEDNEDSFLQEKTYSDGIVTLARKKVQVLEEELNRINKHYFDYKNKYSVGTVSDSDISLRSSIESEKKEKEDTECVTRMERFCQTDRNNSPFRNVTQKGKNKCKVTCDGPVGQSLEKTERGIMHKIKLKSPTKRQLENREIFLRNRKLLEDFEKVSKCILSMSTESNSSSFGSQENRKECDKGNGESNSLQIDRSTNSHHKTTFIDGTTSSEGA